MSCMNPRASLVPPHACPTGVRRWRASGVALALALLGTANWAQTGPTPPAPASTPTPAQPSAMDAELFYQLLLGELNVRGGDPGAGYSLMLDAARRTNDAQLFRRAVDIALQGRAGEAALSAARAWGDALPTSQDALRMQLQILIALNRTDAVRAPLERLLALTPANERDDTINAIPQTLARLSDKEAALRVAREALGQALAGGRHAGAAWTTVGRMELALERLPQALDAARRGQAADAGSRFPVLLALQLMDRRVNGAEAVVTRYLQGGAADGAAVRLSYARTLLDLQRHNDAQRELERLTQATDAPPESWLLLGSLHLQDNRLDAASTALQRFLELLGTPIDDQARRTQTQAYLLLAQVAEKRKDFVAAGQWLDRVSNPDELLAVQMRRASVLARQGRMDEARELLRRHPERLPSDARAKLMAEAQLLREAGRYQDAYEVYARAVARFPDDADLVYEQAMMAERAGRADEMEQLLRGLIARKPDFHHAYNALGYSLADRNVRLPEAKQLIQKALEFAPGDPYIQDSLGWVEFRMGNTATALRILREAYGRKPDAEIAAHLGEVLWVSGQREQARAVWREGLLLNADNDTLRDTLRRFQVEQP